MAIQPRQPDRKRTPIAGLLNPQQTALVIRALHEEVVELRARLEGSNLFKLQPESVEPAMLDAGTATKQAAFRQRIDAAERQTHVKSVSEENDVITVTTVDAGGNEVQTQFALTHSAGGLNQGAVDLRIQALVRSFGLQHSADKVPASRVAAPQAALGANQLDTALDAAIIIDYSDGASKTTKLNDIKVAMNLLDNTDVERYAQVGTQDRIAAGRLAPDGSADKVLKYVRDGTMRWGDETAASGADYSADLAVIARGLLIAAQESTPGGPTNQDLAFVGDGADWIVNDPFASITGIEYHSAGEHSGRYTVSATIAQIDADELARLRVGANDYPLSYYETETGQGFYETPVVLHNDRITAAGDRSMNVQFASGAWASGQTATTRATTIDKHLLRLIAGGADEVHDVPADPVRGQRVELLRDLTFPGRSEVKFAESADGSAFVLSDALGSEDPPLQGVGTINAYTHSAQTAAVRNKITILPVVGKVPTKIVIDNQSYVTAQIAGLQHFYAAAGITTDSIQVGKAYSIQVEFADGTRAVADIEYMAGAVLVWTGTRWIPSGTAKTDQQVTDLANIAIDAAVTARNLPVFWFGTQAEFDAIAAKHATTLYFISG